MSCRAVYRRKLAYSLLHLSKDVADLPMIDYKAQTLTITIYSVTLFTAFGARHDEIVKGRVSSGTSFQTLNTADFSASLATARAPCESSAVSG